MAASAKLRPWVGTRYKPLYHIRLLFVCMYTIFTIPHRLPSSEPPPLPTRATASAYFVLYFPGGVYRNRTLRRAIFLGFHEGKLVRRSAPARVACIDLTSPPSPHILSPASLRNQLVQPAPRPHIRLLLSLLSRKPAGSAHNLCCAAMPPCSRMTT